MTTIIGVRTNAGPIDAVVLGADTLLSYYDKEDKPIGKTPLYKIVFGEFWALGHAGNVTDALRQFYNRLTRPDSFRGFGKAQLAEMIASTVKRQRFIEIDEINAKDSKVFIKKGADFENDFEPHEFLFAVNKPELSLYMVDPYGNLIPPEEDTPYLVLGSGRDLAIKHIEDKLEGETLDANNMDLRTAFSLCNSALNRADKDIATGGPCKDFTIVRPEGVFSFGKQLRRALLAAEDAAYESILAEQEKIGP